VRLAHRALKVIKVLPERRVLLALKVTLGRKAFREIKV
jgi:hypothetical protein